jgi:hypothetical protein
MKETCTKEFNLGDIVHYVIITNDAAYAPAYKIIEKLENFFGFQYTIEIDSKNNTPEIIDMANRNLLPRTNKMCGDSLFVDKLVAIQKASDHFSRMMFNIVKLKESLEEKEEQEVKNIDGAELNIPDGGALNIS